VSNAPPPGERAILFIYQLAILLIAEVFEVAKFEPGDVAPPACHSQLIHAEPPFKPEVPDVPDVPLFPELPDVPLVPELPEEPLEPEEPLVPLEPDVPD